MAINFRIDALSYPNQQDPCFSITVLPVVPAPNQPAPAIPPVQESFCSFCLRQRPSDGAFYGYNIENCPILRETMEEIFGPKFKLEKFSICTPCWNMVQLMDDFRTCCFEANSRVERLKHGINGDDEDGWFTEETVKRIETLHSTVRDQIELIKAFEEIPEEPTTDNNVFTIDSSDSEDDSVHDLVIDEMVAKQDHSEDPIEMILESEHQPAIQDRPKDVVEIVQLPKSPNRPKQDIEVVPKPTVLDCSEDDVMIVEDPQPPLHDLTEDTEEMLPEVDNSITSTNNVEQPKTTHLNRTEATIESSTSFNVKDEPEEPDDHSMQTTPAEDLANHVDPKDASDGNKLQEISSTQNIKTEVMLPSEVTNQTGPPEDHNDNPLFTEISIESIKVEQDGVGEKIAKLVNARVNQCGRCGKSYNCSRMVFRHLESCRHQDAVAEAASTGTASDGVTTTMMYTCQICWASYRSRTNFKAHINQHAGFKQYRCRLMCKKQFFGLKGRNKHEAKCNAYIGCAVCERPFTTKEALFAHIKEAHGKIAFSCELCEIRFSSKISLRNHKYHMHREREGGYLCKRCRIHRSKTAHDANLHLYECKQSFTFTCDQCNAQLQNRSCLRVHIEQSHGEPIYGCDFCDKKFKRRYAAYRHQVLHTESGAGFRCQKCLKLFKTITSLRKHMNVHFSVRPFACASCPKQFCSKQALVKHLKKSCLKRSQQGGGFDLENQADEV